MSPMVYHIVSAGSMILLDMGGYEPPRGKTNNVFSEQVRHKLSCTSTEKC